MGTIGVKYKILPESIETDLKEIEEEIKKLVEEFNGTNKEYSQEPIAFGLKALIAFFYCDEEQELEELENKIQNLEGISSMQIIDMRKVG
jgi:translation elongation factor aEF-1 beta